jgi:hypothetical protein
MQPTTTTHRRRRTTIVTALALTVLVGGAMTAHAQDDARPGGESNGSSVERPLRERAWDRAHAMPPGLRSRMGIERGPGAALRGGPGRRGDGHAVRDRSLERAALFARWLAHDADTGPVAPGLVGRVPDGTEVRLHVYDGDPTDGGALLVTLGHVAGTDGLGAFQAELREAATDATHIVVDVLGRTVALPSSEDSGAADD